MADTRDYHILDIWGRLAETTIPADPISGQSYRRTSVDAAEFEEGWPYDTLVDSADFNQKMFLITSTLQEVDQQGLLGWNDDVDYGADALVRGSDGIFYASTAATGPSTTVYDPVGDVSGTWETLADRLGVGGGGFDIDALPDGSGITLVAADRIAFSDQDDQIDRWTDIQALQDFMQSNLSFGGGLLGIQVFTANGTYTPNGAATSAWVICTGGGGGAGAGGVAGGTSSFGVICSATGGNQGGNAGGTTFVGGGAGGIGTGGLINSGGGAGGGARDFASEHIAGEGGASFWGGGGRAGSAPGNGTAFGSGGGGENTSNSRSGGGAGGTAIDFIASPVSTSVTIGAGGAGAAGSGNGADGIIVVFEFG